MNNQRLSSHHPQPKLSRRGLFMTAAGAAGAALAVHAALPKLAGAQGAMAMPRPIPGGLKLPWGVFIHHYPPKVGGKLSEIRETSQIYDFDGHLTGCRIYGTGTGTNTRSGAKTRMAFMADVGFMQGTYVGEDGAKHDGAFGFI